MKINKEYKDRVFRLIFGNNKTFLLSLYNALNDTAYDNPDELDVNTIDDAIYMGMKNDVSCIISNTMSVFEQQSTYNPNMPLRELEYCAKLYGKYVIRSNKDIYGSSLIKMPAPQCYVFYNGDSEHSDLEVLKLSDAFEHYVEGYEWTVNMININRGYNKELLSRCKPLEEYAQLVYDIKEYRKIYTIEEAVDKAVLTCIDRKGILSGMLEAHRAEVVDMLLTEYNEEEHMESVFNNGREEGRLLEIVSFVKDGICSIETGATRAGMTIEEFEKAMQQY